MAFRLTKFVNATPLSLAAWRAWRSGSSSRQTSTYSGSRLLLTASALTEQGQIETIRTAGWEHWGSIVYSALMASIVGHGLFFYLVQRHPVSSVMPYLQITPVIAVVFGILAWGDQPGWRLLIGGGLVILGILFITLRARGKVLRTA